MRAAVSPEDKATHAFLVKDLKRFIRENASVSGYGKRHWKRVHADLAKALVLQWIDNWDELARVETTYDRYAVPLEPWECPDPPITRTRKANNHGLVR